MLNMAVTSYSVLYHVYVGDTYIIVIATRHISHTKTNKNIHKRKIYTSIMFVLIKREDVFIIFGFLEKNEALAEIHAMT